MVLNRRDDQGSEVRVIGECVECRVATESEEGEFCFICDDLKSVCWNCMAQHLTDNHTQIEYMKAEMELTV